jgi:D-amino-acid dehydrogenase
MTNSFNIPSSPTIIVLGAGIVGISTALTLQRNGQQVLLIDRKQPCQETSFGNAGILSTGSLLPMNNPTLLKKLPSILTNRQAAVRYDWPYVFKNTKPMLQFINNSRAVTAKQNAASLHQLISSSIAEHQDWMQQTGISHRLRKYGWIKLFRSEKSFENTTYDRSIFDQHDIDYQILNNTQIQERIPALNPIFPQAIWIRDSYSVDNPYAVGMAYFQSFLESGGKFLQTEITTTSQKSNRWQITNSDGQAFEAEKLIVCLGYWSKAFLKKVGLNLPLIAERGSHRIFHPEDPDILPQPIYDMDACYVMSPMEGKLRLTSGVSLRSPDKIFQFEQLNQVTPKARQAFREPLGATYESEDWVGTRPTLPDDMPAIGQTKLPGLWLNLGHQHIGLTLAPGSATHLLKLMQANSTEVDNAFSPTRLKL